VLVADLELLGRVEAFYDAVPRDRADVEQHGGLVLFVPNGTVGAFYGRPSPDGRPVTAADIASLRARQRELGLPEALEWVHELNPDLIELAEAAGLAVLRAPLMVLDPAALPTPGPGVRLLAPDTPTLAEDLAACDAVAAVGFAVPGTGGGAAAGGEESSSAGPASRPAAGGKASSPPAPTSRPAAGGKASSPPAPTSRPAAGPAHRDAAQARPSPQRLRTESARLAAGLSARALAETPDIGVAACGQYQRAGDVVEIVGVATLPAARRRGLASAVTAALARHALDEGATLVLLSAAEEAVARIYARLGFRRIGTACIAEPANRKSAAAR
jgi:GNAT superfamily N-acetyltransferase